MRKKYHKIDIYTLLNSNYTGLEIKDEDSARTLITLLKFPEEILNLNERTIKNLNKAKRYYTDLNFFINSDGVLYIYFQDFIKIPDSLDVYLRFDVTNGIDGYDIILVFLDLKYNINCRAKILNIRREKFNKKINFEEEHIAIVEKLIKANKMPMEELFAEIDREVKGGAKVENPPGFFQEYLLFK